MGSGSSREQGFESSQHIFAASAPTTFSGSLLESLEKSPKSDTTRSANLELKIQSRLNAELSKISEAESTKLKETTQALATENSDSSSFDSSSSLSSSGAGSSFIDPTGEQARKKSLTHSSVSKEIAELKKKLDGRKKVEEADAGVEKAREGLVQCLRLNDRRPLDCWEEREAFKREVARLERQFVDKTLS